MRWLKVLLMVGMVLAAASGAQALSDDERREIDEILAARGLNQYGDPVDTMYAGGTPLFDERTGESIDRHEYVLRQHPDIRRDLHAAPRRESFVAPPPDRASGPPPPYYPHDPRYPR